MFRFARLGSALVLALLAAPLVACASESQTARCSAVSVARTAAPPQPVAGCQPAAVAALQSVGFAVDQPVGVEYRVGAAEYTRSAFQLPGGWVKCGSTWLYKVGVATGEALECLGGSLVLDPPPSARYVFAPPPAIPAAPVWQPPPAASPCQPPAQRPAFCP